ncbi:hypothetical protein JCM19297_2440 [Nonlabens ulvanivorans]|nr:hypothetical protein [Nonlabens ulvanivorans]GAK90995.1 hypothetical protein JCM19297_2440 [Nonlabens ulvanivorans]
MVVESVNHLKQLASNKNGNIQEVYIVLAVRLVRSSKRILYDKKLDEFFIVNEIDNTYQELLASEIGDRTTLISAIEAKALYMYPVQSTI